MHEPLLVINAGSSSCKFSIYETMPDRSVTAGAHGQVEDNNYSHFWFSASTGGSCCGLR
jgi:acetate kinase